MKANVSILLLLAVGCADPLVSPDTGYDAGAGTDSSADSGAGIPAATGRFRHEASGREVVTDVDASDAMSWQYLDFDTGVSTDDPARWDLAFRRFFVRMNGGASGAGGVLASVVEGDYESVERAPEMGWSSAVADGADDDDSEPDTPFNNGVDDWYDYDVTTHTLTPKSRVYAVRTTAGSYVRMQLTDYYDTAGSPAQVTFRWALIDAPMSDLPDAGTPDVGPGMDAGMDAGTDASLPDDGFMIDASAAMEWTYVSLSSQRVVSVSAPSESADWDLAFRRTEVRTNSGTHGMSGVGAGKESDDDYDALVATDTFDFVSDAEVDSGRPGVSPAELNPVVGNWFDYNPSSHSLTPRDTCFVIRGGDGSYYKLAFLDWADGIYALRASTLEHTSPSRELTLDASDSDAWAGVDLSQEGGEPDATRWDVGASRTRWRSHGGESAEGMAAVAVLTLEDIDALDDPSEFEGYAFVADTEIPPSRPGATGYVGNAALSDWFDYDGTTHLVSPKSRVFLVRTRTGELAALQIIGWEDGVYRLAMRYAGPRQEVFR